MILFFVLFLLLYVPTNMMKFLYDQYEERFYSNILNHLYNQYDEAPIQPIWWSFYKINIMKAQYNQYDNASIQAI